MRRRHTCLTAVKRIIVKMLACAAVLLCLAQPICAAAADEETEAVTENAAEAQEQDTYNLLLIGSDRRTDNWNGNSDTMILVTVNSAAETNFIVSFMRDTGVNIPGHGTNKLNSAYAIGGAELLEETLSTVFGVSIDNYVAADMTGVINIIDALGGADIEMTEDEEAYMPWLIQLTCENLGLVYEDYALEPGQTHLDGVQTLSYMRNRSVGNDYARTQRQRTVLTSMLETIDLSDATQISEVLQTVLDNTQTDINVLDILRLVPVLSKALSYEVVTDRIPYDDLMTHSGEMLVPVQPGTNERLLGEIYPGATEE